ncbi:MAG: hypothetical protein SFU83_16350 [Meiothermus sp.]|nr:hypothetical protein [Meiothermus sp.]
MTAEPRRNQGLEDSPDYFWERFSAYAGRLAIGPEPTGSPMLELITPFGPLYTFDRGLVPVSGGSAEVLLHGQVEQWSQAEGEPRVQYIGQGRYELSGQVEELPGGTFFVLRVDEGPASLRFLLSSSNPPTRGAQVTARLAPPLMSFRAP